MSANQTSTSVPGYSYDFYRTVIITVPVLVPLVVIPLIFSIKCICGCIHKTHAQIWTKTAKMFALSKEKKIYFHGPKKPSRWIIALLLIKALLFLMFSLAVFLNESVVTSHFGCIAGRWDCFEQDSGQFMRIRNCSNLGEFSTDHVHCYRISVELSTAIGEVGGLIFVIKIVVTAYIMVYFSVRHIHDRCLRIATGIGINLAFFLLAVGWPIGFAVGHVRLTETETLTFQMHNIINAVYYSLLYFAVTAAMLLRTNCTFDDFPEHIGSNTTVITVGAPTAGENGTVTTADGSVMPAKARVEITHGDKSQTIHVI